MGYKYRKRVTLFPGFKINISKSGMSATIGMKGLSVNVGQRGTYLNTGIPGTGIYNRVRLDKSTSKNQIPDNYNIRIPMLNEVVEVKSYQPEVMTSDGLFGLKESIINARQEKQELKNIAKKALKQRKKAFFILFVTRMLIFGFIIK